MAAHRITFENNTVRDNEGWGLFVDGATQGTIIRNNTIEDTGIGRQKTGIRLGKNAGAVVLADNTIRAAQPMLDERRNATGADAPNRSWLYAMCVEMGVPGINPRPLSEQAALLREFGFKGLGNELWLDGQLPDNLKILDDARLPLLMCWTLLNVNPTNGPAYGSALPQAIRQLKGRPVTVCVLLQGLPPSDPQGFGPATKALRELGDVAAEAGVRLSVYHHLNDWSESLPLAIEVVNQVNHSQVGFNFNLCHWLKVDGAKDYRPWLRKHAAKLFCVTLNGATSGAKDWANGLIRPLDEGDFDLHPLLAVLEEIHYPGPIGLMCYGIPGDPRDYLARSLRTWRSLLAAVRSTR
jgi:parallel beta-helix repeat protein